MSLITKSLYILLFGYMLFIPKISAQEKIELSLKETLKLAGENNFDILSAEAEVDAMRADKNKSLSVFLPGITLSETFVRTNDPLSAFGFKLKQEIVSQMDFNPALLNDPDEINNYTTKAEIQQPVINIDGYFGRAAAGRGLSALEHKQERTENYISFMVKMSYYELILQRESLDVIEQSLEAAEANKKLIKDYYDEGLVTRADYLNTEVHVSNLESQRLEAINKTKSANDQLLLLLGLDGDKKIVPVDTLSKPVVTGIEYDTREAVNNRSDIQARMYRIESLRLMKKSNWSKYLPRLNAFGSYEFNDDNIFGTSANNWMVGWNLQWKIFDGFKNAAGIQKSSAEIKIAEAEYSKAKIEAIKEVKESLRSLETVEKKLLLAKTAVDQSDESLRIINDRYSKGLEKTSDLLSAETAASASKLKYLKSLFFYNVSLFKIELMLEKKILNN